MRLNVKSLQELCNTHSVVGDTLQVIDYLEQRLKKMKVKCKKNGFGVLLCGNLINPKIMISAHADEVGFQVIKKNDDGTFVVNNCGAIDAVMLNNSQVYVETSSGKIPGTFYPKKELGDNKPSNFNEIFLDTIKNDSVKVGDFGSYTREFYHEGNKIMATGLDNKISVEMILELIEENKDMLKNTLFTFMTEEEAGYDCSAGISVQYQPDYALVLDMLPVHQSSQAKAEVIPEVGQGPAILYSMHKYYLNPNVRNIIETLKEKYQRAYLDIHFSPEAQIVQRNGVTKGVNILLPMLGWHNCMYTIDIKDYVSMKQLVLALHKKLNNK